MNTGAPARERVLVTGASGFLGTHITRGLRHAGFDVQAVARRRSCIDDLDVEPADLTDAAVVEALAQKRPAGTIVHLASAIPSVGGQEEDDACCRANVASTMAVLTLARAWKSAVVYASSSAVYGNMAGKGTVDEESTVAPQNLYAVSKYFGELAVAVYARQQQARAVILRISAPYGRGQRVPTVVRHFVAAALESRDVNVYGSGNRTQQFTHVSDIARAVAAAVSGSASGVFNVASVRPFSMRELAELTLRTIPESKSRLVVGANADPQDDYRAHLSIAKAALLPWTPSVTMADGLRDVAAGLRAGAC